MDVQKISVGRRLQHVSFRLHSGEFVAVIGPSGHGKSTLTRALIHDPGTRSQGQVLINGRDIRKQIAWFRSRLGYVSQNAALHADLSAENMMAFAAALRGAAVEAGTQVLKEVEFPEARLQTLRYLEKLSTFVHFSHVGIGDYSTRSQIQDTLMIALEDCRTTRLLYHSIHSDSSTEAIVHPHGPVYHQTALYLVAFVPIYGELRHYKVDWIRDANHLNKECFTRIENFDLRTHFASSFGIFHKNGTPYDIRIHFARKAAWYVEEHRWHESQQLTTHPDGSATLQLQLTSLEEIKSWILSFGAKARVEEPEELREMIAADLEKLAAEYLNSRQVVR